MKTEQKIEKLEDEPKFLMMEEREQSGMIKQDPGTLYNVPMIDSPVGTPRTPIFFKPSKEETKESDSKVMVSSLTRPKVIKLPRKSVAEHRGLGLAQAAGKSIVTGSIKNRHDEPYRVGKRFSHSADGRL